MPFNESGRTPESWTSRAVRKGFSHIVSELTRCRFLAFWVFAMTFAILCMTTSYSYYLLSSIFCVNNVYTNQDRTGQTEQSLWKRSQHAKNGAAGRVPE